MEQLEPDKAMLQEHFSKEAKCSKPIEIEELE